MSYMYMHLISSREGPGFLASLLPFFRTHINLLKTLTNIVQIRFIHTCTCHLISTLLAPQEYKSYLSTVPKMMIDVSHFDSLLGSLSSLLSLTLYSIHTCTCHLISTLTHSVFHSYMYMPSHLDSLPRHIVSRRVGRILYRHHRHAHILVLP